MERIDKIIAVSQNISRSDAAKLIKSGAVSVNGVTIKSVKQKFDETSDEIICQGQKAEYKKFVYIMMNKPPGVISAAEGRGEKTVIDILPDNMKRKGLFPAGRLDKDTTGFMLITDDGDFAHRILSPNKHIEKTYIACLDKPFNEKIINEFSKGVMLGEDLCMPARLSALDDDMLIGEVVIKQGMYHQIKRMFSKFGITVLKLKRTSMGYLPLDDSLNEGECRYLTAAELEKIEMK